MRVVREEKKRCLVTGGAGFIGSHLCDSLLAHGHHVVCVDSLVTGSIDNIGHHMGNPNFAFLEHDVTVPLSVDADEIFNLASAASPVQYQSDPIGTTRTAILGALNMLDLARTLDCRILQASTSEVYGDPQVHPQTEDYWGHVNPIGRRACYDEGKRCAETFFFDYHRQHGVDVRVARIFNTYGPRVHRADGRVVSNFVVQALDNAPLTLHGEGQQTRSFCYVSDMVEGLRALMAYEGPQPGPVNLGNPDEISMRELAADIIALTCSRSAIESHPLPEDDPRQRCPDISKAMDLLGWAPTVHLKDGLRETVAYFTKTAPGLSDDTQETGREAG